MQSIYSKYKDDFLEGSETIYNYGQLNHYNYLFSAQIVGIQNIGPNYYNELAMAKEYQIQFTIEGSGLASINNEDIVLKSGDLLIISNYQHHIFQPISGENWKIAFIHIYENDVIMEIFNKIYKKNRHLIRNVDQINIVPYITNIISLYKNSELDEDTKGLMVSNQIYQLLMKICEQSNIYESNKVDQKLASVVRFIEQNFNTPITLKDILEHTIYSKNHLERLFKKEMNMSMQAYISKLRIKRAQELILKTNMYFNEIALQVGLNDYRSLHYLFTKKTGISPAEFRKRNVTIAK